MTSIALRTAIARDLVQPLYRYGSGTGTPADLAVPHRHIPITIRVVETTPYADQSPGTSGLRKKTSVFRQRHYLENFVQSVFLAQGGVRGKTLVVGGDGRLFNREAAQKILRMAAAGGAARVVIGKGALLSTPAASHLIRARGADFGLILSASHNPGGEDGDFGVKINGAGGEPAPIGLTSEIHQHSKNLRAFLYANAVDTDLDSVGLSSLGNMLVEVVDAVEDYAALMRTQFDFDAIRDLFARWFEIRFDAMHGACGPYARHILEDILGAAEGSVVNGEPREDFGGCAPDPTPAHLSGLFDLMCGPAAPDLAAAADGDGDRSVVLGRGIYIAPSDGLAMLAANARLVPAFAQGLRGVARSMPTSRALDRVAARLAIPCFETLTGWKHFCSLLDHDLVSLCGEESAGTGSPHVREKDGLWTVLMWLNIIAVRRQSIGEIAVQHYRSFGRDYTLRCDYHGLEAAKANRMLDDLRFRLGGLAGRSAHGGSIALTLLGKGVLVQMLINAAGLGLLLACGWWQVSGSRLCRRLPSLTEAFSVRGAAASAGAESLMRLRGFIIAAGLALGLGPGTPAPAAAGEIRMASFASRHLAREYRYLVYEPGGAPGRDRLPVVYLLHGADGDARDWVEQGAIKETADRLIRERRIKPMLLVMPSGGACWWIDSAQCRMDRVFWQELEPHVAARSDAASGPASRAIAGVSAGGFGAIRHALRNPRLFAAVAALSPAIYEGLPPPHSRARSQPVFLDALGRFDPDAWRRENYTAALAGYATGQARVPVYLASGDHDEYGIALEAARLHQALLSTGREHAHLRIDSGDHSWAYWSGEISAMLTFLSGRLGPDGGGAWSGGAQVRAPDAVAAYGRQ